MVISRGVTERGYGEGHLWMLVISLTEQGAGYKEAITLGNSMHLYGFFIFFFVVIYVILPLKECKINTPTMIMVCGGNT